MPFTDAELADMHRRQRLVDAEKARLKAQGHTCIVELETYPTRLRSCETLPCSGKAVY